MISPRSGTMLGVWAATLLLVPAGSREGTVADLLLAGAWLAALLGLAYEASEASARSRARDLLALVSGGLLCALWAVAPHAYPTALVLLLSALACRGELRPAMLTLVPACLPLPVVALAWAVGDDTAHAMLQNEWSPPSFSFAWWSIVLRFETILVAGTLGGRLLLGEAPRASTTRLVRAAPWLAGVVVVAVVVARAATIGSLVDSPLDSGWSEPPLLLNLLRLDVGAPIYTPLSDCNSYSYAPTLELAHHALLAPFHMALSLPANRVLDVGWVLVAAAILVAVARGAPRRLAVPVMVLVAASSFIVPKLHPDHLLMPCFALALGLAVHRDRLPERVLLAGLVLVPALATAVKLTGAGIGLGLVLAFAWPVARRRWAALAASAVLSFGVLAAFEHAMPRFLQYTLGLQASHPMRWSALATLPTEPATRVFLVACAALAASRFYPPAASRHEWRAAARDAGCALLVTLGFALPSLVAYVKVGGRANSLLPLAIGGAVILARLSAELVAVRATRALAAVLAAWLALAVSPPIEPLTARAAAAARADHAQTVALVRAETASGRRTLLYGSTNAWIEAGQRTIPLDRWQTVSELVLGHHPEASAHLERLASGYYASVILSDATIPLLDAPTREVLARLYVVERAASDATTHVWRWTGAAAP